MSLNTCSAVSLMILSMMGIFVGSWDVGVGKSMTINTGFSSDGDSELMTLISGSPSSRNEWSTSMTFRSSIEGDEGY